MTSGIPNGKAWLNIKSAVGVQILSHKEHKEKRCGLVFKDYGVWSNRRAGVEDGVGVRVGDGEGEGVGRVVLGEFV